MKIKNNISWFFIQLLPYAFAHPVLFVKKSFFYVGQFFRYLIAILSGRYQKFAKWNLFKIFLVAIYIFSPFDFLPDFIPFIGWLDDASLLIYILKTIKIEIDNFLSWQKMLSKNDISS